MKNDPTAFSRGVAVGVAFGLAIGVGLIAYLGIENDALRKERNQALIVAGLAVLRH